MSDEIVQAWHFTGNTLRNGDPIPPVGEWLTCDRPLVMCVTGLHASVHPFDALRYAPGPRLHRVECSGEMIHQDDKLVCSSRRIVASADATSMLRRFAKDQALSVINLWDCPQVVKNYLQSDNDDNRDAAWAAALDAARAAALDAAWDAALDAALDAAWAAARDAALDAAWDAALDAAWAAALDAARAAALDAAWAATWDAARDAAWAATWDAAWAAARDAARAEFARRVDELFKRGDA